MRSTSRSQRCGDADDLETDLHVRQPAASRMFGRAFLMATGFVVLVPLAHRQFHLDIARGNGSPNLSLAGLSPVWDSVLPRRLERRAQVRGQSQEIGKDAPGGHLRTRSRPLNHERVFVVSPSSEQHDIVHLSDSRKRMRQRIGA